VIAPGQRIGHYLIEKRLGAGGMGEVFRAFDESLERPVAVKVLPTAVEKNEEARARMLREARAASALVHPGIVTVHEVGEHEGSIFLVMEYVEGETFSQVIARRGPLPPAEAVKLVQPVASALVFAHKAGFVHRDIKCSNLMVTPDGHVKVLDFGLSKRMRREPAPAAPGPAAAPATVGIRKGAAGQLADAARAVDVAASPEHATRPGTAGAGHGAPPTMPDGVDGVDATGPTVASLDRRRVAKDDLTVAGSAMGTPGYSALELMDGREADARADVFSLGVVLFELLTALRPYSGKTWGEVSDEVAAERYPRAAMLVPTVSAELDAVIVGALRADRDARTPSVAAFLAGLTDASATPRRRRRAVLVIAGAMAVSAGTWGVMQLRARGATRPAAADAAVVAIIPDGDAAGAEDAGGDDAPAPAPARVTRFGGCAEAPAFVDAHAVVFDLSPPGGTRDLHLLDLDSGAKRQLTRAPTSEWRAAPGLAAGELVYLVTDPHDDARSKIVARDVGSDRDGEEVGPPSIAVAAARGEYYFVGIGGGTLRASKRNKVERTVLPLRGVTPLAMTASPDGRWLAMVASTPTSAADVCLADLDATTLRCTSTHDVREARPAFGTRDTLYYAGRNAIHARSLSGDGPGGDHVAVRGVFADGGVAVSPDGRTMVFSDCFPAGPLRAVGGPPPVEDLTDEHELVTHVVAGPGGRIAWVREGVVVVRQANGETFEIPAGGPTDRITFPAFSRDGNTVAYARVGAEPGIVTYAPGLPPQTTRVTQQPGDDRPLFLDDGSLVFTRLFGETPYVYRLVPGADPERARLEPRRTIGIDRRGGRVLLSSADGRILYWWYPARDAETAGPPSSVPGAGPAHEISLSPDGGWMLFRVGRELWRTSTASWQPEQVYAPPEAVTIEHSAIRDDGQPLAIELSWRGELWRVDAGGEPW
jgi:serine/threonine protein kinase